ncbi:uncharacterized protein BT62DRAFT_1079199 [Guyanagaster necrorhizus]|uniref:Uncharacterized protein n=1 Tax=Guyanagaster necrorhizus TaxID=856835 RepID=A0A9P8AQ80_9AGAR|nr:uncharacterized protein BT62DRAFT_1079199 [Guyanagaster necrorhizus MCA 3950]KAG7442597.1 hypothetical protein BT62DRAFT_1079199 [Guyanagaster necrorhizus MCA 3950]
MSWLSILFPPVDASTLALGPFPIRSGISSGFSLQLPWDLSLPSASFHHDSSLYTRRIPWHHGISFTTPSILTLTGYTSLALYCTHRARAHKAGYPPPHPSPCANPQPSHTDPHLTLARRLSYALQPPPSINHSATLLGTSKTFFFRGPRHGTWDIGYLSAEEAGIERPTGNRLFILFFFSRKLIRKNE